MSAPIAIDYEDIAELNSADSFIFNVLTDAELYGGTISSIDIINLEREAGGIINPAGYVSIINDGTMTISPGLNPGQYSLIYTITTENGESNEALITFEITQMDFDTTTGGSNGTFTSNALDLDSISVSQTPDLIFVRDIAKTDQNLHNKFFTDYVESKNLSPQESTELYDQLVEVTKREMDSLKIVGKEVYDDSGPVTKRRIELLPKPGVSTLKIAYDVDR